MEEEMAGYQSDTSLKLAMSTEEEDDDDDTGEQNQQEHADEQTNQNNSGNAVSSKSDQDSNSNSNQTQNSENDELVGDFEADDVAIAIVLQEQEYQILQQQEQQQHNNNNNYNCNNKKRRRSNSNRRISDDDDHVCDDSFEDCFDLDDCKYEKYVVDEHFGGFNEFEIDTRQLEKQIKVRPKEKYENQEQTNFESSEENFESEDEIQQEIEDDEQILIINKTRNSGKIKLLNCPTEFQPPLFTKPYFLFEQVASCLGDALNICSEELRSDLVFIDSYPQFSYARRRRVYATNLRNHEKIQNWIVPKRRSLNSILDWPEEHALPIWTNSLFKILPVKTILASCKKLVSADEWNHTLKILDCHEWNETNHDENQIKQFFLEKTLQRLNKMNLVPNFQKTLSMLTPEQKEELMGFPIGHTKIKNWHNLFQTEYKFVEARDAALGNSFQCDTVAYLLSPLFNIQLNNQNQKLNVLSLFDGIGGAAVALKKLNVQVRKYYSSEINGFSKILSRRFVENELKCEFVDVGDVENVNKFEFLGKFVGDEKIDVVVGGPPCSNLSGANQHSGDVGRTGIAGEKSKLFFHYAQIIHHLENLYSRSTT